MRTNLLWIEGFREYGIRRSTDEEEEEASLLLWGNEISIRPNTVNRSCRREVFPIVFRHGFPSGLKIFLDAVSDEGTGRSCYQLRLFQLLVMVLRTASRRKDASAGRCQFIIS